MQTVIDALPVVLASVISYAVAVLRTCQKNKGRKSCLLCGSPLDERGRSCPPPPRGAS